MVSRAHLESARDGAPARTADTDRPIVARTVSTDLALDTLRACAQELGYTEIALALHLRGEASYSAYVHRVLAGDKPLPLEWLEALPDDLKARFYARRAEQLGHLVVTSVTDPEEARRMVLAGLLALLPAAQLPAKAGAPLKVSLAAPASALRRAVR